MRTLTKIKIDRKLGKPVVFCINILARALGAILGVDHAFKKNPDSIVVCKLMGLGNIIQAIPLLHTLKENFPTTVITFITRRANQELAELLPFTDHTLLIDDRSFTSLIVSSFKVIFKLWKKRNDIYIDLETYSNYSTILATLSLSRNRLSFYRREDHIKLGIFTHMMFYNNNIPISKVYLQMARFVGCNVIYPEYKSFSFCENDKSNFIERLEVEFGITKGTPIILINPNSSDMLKERKWPADNFVQLINEISQLYNDNFLVLIGSKNERDYVNNLFDRISLQDRKKVKNLSGKLKLSELILLIELSHYIITNDSGPMHIALTLKKNTIALFGPHSPAMIEHDPNFIPIYKNTYCSPCVHEFLIPPCKGNNICMKQISVEEVKNVFILLHNKKEFSEKVQEKNIIYSFDEKPLGVVLR